MYNDAVINVVTSVKNPNTVNVRELLGKFSHFDSDESSGEKKFSTRIRKSSIELWIQKINSQFNGKNKDIKYRVLGISEIDEKERNKQISDLREVENGCFDFMKIENGSSVKFFSSFGSSDKDLKKL